MPLNDEENKVSEALPVRRVLTRNSLPKVLKIKDKNLLRVCFLLNENLYKEVLREFKMLLNDMVWSFRTQPCVFVEQHCLRHLRFSLDICE